ncbi:helix-turn-helix domain-containing protein [Limosilactobacillus allomucosae]|uniref:Helix-turn-helix domain-containing protein n=1 Tax=Limosilactobacillus allomucosae TaxID=3142938 RepID=A0AAU7C019_9LACO
MKYERYHFGANLVLEIISGKWKPSIICSLDARPKRFNELKAYLQRVNGQPIAQKVLTEQLRQLENDLIVKRTDYHTVPFKVVYSLTEDGQRIHDFLIEMSRVGENLARHLASADQPIAFDYSYQQMIHHQKGELHAKS